MKINRGNHQIPSSMLLPALIFLFRHNIINPYGMMQLLNLLPQNTNHIVIALYKEADMQIVVCLFSNDTKI